MNNITYFRQKDQLGWVDLQRIIIIVIGYGKGRLLTGPLSSTLSRYDDGRIGSTPKTHNEWRSMQLVAAVEEWLLSPEGVKGGPLGSLAEVVNRLIQGDIERGFALDWSLPPYEEWTPEDKSGLDLISRSLLSLRDCGLLGEVSK